MNRTGELKFYPKHPSGSKTHKIETGAMPILEQNEPFDVKKLFNEYEENADSFLAKYVDKRFEVTGIARKVGPDIHNKPSIEISDSIDGESYALVIFPTDAHYSKVEVGDKVVVRANYLVMSNHYGTVMKYSELVDVEKAKSQERVELKYPFFDGKNVIEDSAVVLEGGRIVGIRKAEVIDDNYFLMPGLIDAHTHMSTAGQVESMLKNGVTATCDVAASADLVRGSKQLRIISSAGMTMGTLNGKGYVKKAIEDGAKYIKILLMEPNLMLKGVLRDICSEAHKNGIKVAAHAVSVKAVQLSVECGVDILLHVPMKEEFPEELADAIAAKKIAVAPTLVMMEAFAMSEKKGYKPEQYRNAENAVRLLCDKGVTILAATDANPGFYAPGVPYGTSMHRELALLAQTGMAPADVLAAATERVATAFGIDDIGSIQEGKKATLMLVEGRPDKSIADTVKIKQIWIEGKTIM